MPEAPGRLLVVSDLHLSEGWDSDTKRLFKSEDFFFDHSFGRFLQAQDAKSRAEGHRLRLIIPGDFVDFLQVKTTPPESVQVMEGEFITSREQRFGLGTGPAMTCWKLRKLMDGHWRFFQALASFLVAGHDLVILPGNHDIEWIMPEVQGCFRAELVKYAPPGAGTGIGQQVRFLPWFYYEPDFLYIDHGHQYDALNSFDVFLHPYLPDGRIDLPAGSFFVRYLFNFLELDYPFADNMKPTARFLRWTLRHPRTWRAFPVYWSFFRETLAKAKPWDAQWRAHVEARQREVLPPWRSSSPSHRPASRGSGPCGRPRRSMPSEGFNWRCLSFGRPALRVDSRRSRDKSIGSSGSVMYFSGTPTRRICR